MAKRKLTKKQQREMKKFALANWKVLLVLFLLLVMLTTFAYFMGWLDFLFKEDEDIPPMSEAGGQVTELTEFGSLQVNFLDVGQGDCIIVELPDGKNMIIDGGDTNSDQQVIADFMRNNDILYFDYMLATHSDKDHVANLDWVLENYAVRYMFLPSIRATDETAADLNEDFNPDLINKGAYEDSETYADFMFAAYNEGCKYEFFNKNSDFSNTIKVGEEEKSYLFNFLTPTAKIGEIVYSKANNYSPILMLEYAGKRIMFNGDAETDVLEEYIEQYGNEYNVDVLKVGHHGAENGTTSEYLSAIDPEYAVIQCGHGNTHDHPRKECLDALIGHDGGVAIYRNDCNGTITLTISPSGEMAWDMQQWDMSNNLLPGIEYEKIERNEINSINGRYIIDILNSYEFMPVKKFELM